MRVSLLVLTIGVAQGFLPPLANPSAGRRVCNAVQSGRNNAVVVEGARSNRPSIWRLCMSEDAAVVEPEPVAEESAEKAPRKKRTTLAELAVGNEFTGKVKGIKDFGIFVDIGAESDGLVHISQMSASFVSNPSDIAKVGDTVNVRILNIDSDKRQIALTMKSEAESAAPPPRKRGGGKKDRDRDETDGADEEEDLGETNDTLKDAPVGDKDVSSFENYDPKKFQAGKVVSVQAYGAFIRLDDADIDGLLPSGDMLGKLEVGQCVEVRITDVDTERNRITLSNQPLLRGKRTRFALNKEELDDLEVVARRSGLYASELPEVFEGADDDADWEEAFTFKSGFGDDGPVEDVIEDDAIAVFGEEPEEDDEEFSMGSINVFRSPAWKKERGLVAGKGEDVEDSFKYGGEGAAYFPEDEEDDDGSGVEAYTKNYDTQIPQLSEDELKALVRKAQGTRRNVSEEWAEEEAEEREYLTLTLVPSKKKGKGFVLKQVNAASSEKALEKTRMPIYFSKKMSALKQVELLEELEKLAQDDPLALTK